MRYLFPYHSLCKFSLSFQSLLGTSPPQYRLRATSAPPTTRLWVQESSAQPVRPQRLRAASAPSATEPRQQPMTTKPVSQLIPDVPFVLPQVGSDYPFPGRTLRRHSTPPTLTPHSSLPVHHAYLFSIHDQIVMTKSVSHESVTAAI